MKNSDTNKTYRDALYIQRKYAVYKTNLNNINWTKNRSVACA